MAITCHPPSSAEAFSTGFRHPGLLPAGSASLPLEAERLDGAKSGSTGILRKGLKTCSQPEIVSLFARGGD